MIASLLAVTIVVTASAQSGFAIAGFTIDGGGGVSAGGPFSLVGSIAQPDAGLLAGAQFALYGGILDLDAGEGSNPQPTPTPTSVPEVPASHRIWLPAVEN